MTKYQKAVIINYGYINPPINGSVIDSFEYFYTLWEQDKEFKYIFVDANPKNLQFIKSFLNSRYVINKSCLDNVISVKTKDLILNMFNKILITDSTTVGMMKLNLPIQSKEKHIITEFGKEEFNLKNRKGVTYYSEMPDNRIPDDEYYYTKMRFDLIRKPDSHKKQLYVNAPRYGDFSGSSDSIEFLKKIKSVIDINELNGYMSKGPGNNSNIFEEFNHYLYIKTKTWEDPRPRMFHECYYFNIPIEYYNKYNIKDGSYQRYHELMQNGLDNRHLYKTDILIQKLLN